MFSLAVNALLSILMNQIRVLMILFDFDRIAVTKAYRTQTSLFRLLDHSSQSLRCIVMFRGSSGKISSHIVVEREEKKQYYDMFIVLVLSFTVVTLSGPSVSSLRLGKMNNSCGW